MPSPITIIEADLSNLAHQRDVVAMTNVYAQDVMGNDGPLPPEVLKRLIPSLLEVPTALIFLAYSEGRAVGIATCFWGFTTFAARPLVNIHDFCVVPELRRPGTAGGGGAKGPRTRLREGDARSSREQPMRPTDLRGRGLFTSGAWRSGGWGVVLYEEVVR